MSNEFCFETGEIGPFWVTISDNYHGELTIQIIKGDWAVCDDIVLPLGTPFEEAWKVAADRCLSIVHDWAVDIMEFELELK